MIKTLKHILKLYLFWLLLFAALRLLFLVFNAKYFEQSNIGVFPYIFLYALRLDISAASYLILIPAVMLLVNLVWHHVFLNKLFTYFHYLILFLVIAAMLGNIVIYYYWAAMLSKRALQFLQDPAEVLASVTFLQTAGGLLLFAFLYGSSLILFNRIKLGQLPQISGNVFLKLLTLPLLVFIIAYSLRGGFQLIPVNESSCYFSNKTSENHAAINSLWFLIRNVLLSERAGKQKFVFYDDETCNKLFHSLMKHTPDTSNCFINNPHPNIVIIIGESHTADVVEALGGEQGNSPHLDSLINTSLTFTECYASGSRTDQGLVSIFSGFPAQPDNSIIRHDDKTDKLPYLTAPFTNQNYNTSFFYGGELGFANMKSYLLHAGFKVLSDKNDYTGNTMNSKWGAHDAFVLSKQLEWIKNSPQPFFSAILTLSLHEPFEIPIAPKFAGNSTEVKFKNAAYYTDMCLGNYFSDIKKLPCYSNTLFIFVADHGHHYPRNRDYYSIESHRIPLIFFGGALKNEFRGKRINAITSQNDIATILLNQLGYSTDKFEFSKNSLSAGSKAFAYLCYDDGFTFIENGCSVNYLTSTKVNKVISGNCDSLQSERTASDGKAYLQKLYQTFLDY